MVTKKEQEAGEKLVKSIIDQNNKWGNSSMTEEKARKQVAEIQQKAYDRRNK